MSFPGTIAEALQCSQVGSVTLYGRGDDLTHSYQELAAMSRKVAGGLRAAGVAPCERVLLVLPTGLGFITSFFGCNLAGAIPCQVSPPEGFGSAAMFQRRIGDLAEVVGASAVIAEPDLHESLAAAAPALARLDPDVLAQGDEADPIALGPEDPAFIQFTSGTTRTPKGVLIPQRALSANTQQIGRATRMKSGESAVVSWLPMFHDMGLVSWMVTLFNDLRMVLSTPMTFLRRPVSWLRAIDRHRGTHAPAPTFAFGYLPKRVRDRDLEGLDLSTWKTAYVGAEPIPPGVLRTFEERLAPCGLSKTTLLPCYGMAEATLALTFIDDASPWQEYAVSRAALRDGRMAPPQDPSDTLALVACGTPLEPTELWILDEEGNELGPDTLGEIAVRGPSLFKGYWGQPERDPSVPFRTGDLGFVHDGQLFITGRKKDLIILKGNNHHPEEVEWVAAQVDGVRMGRCAAFALSDPEEGTERLCLLVEVERKVLRDPGDTELEIRRKVHEESGLPIDSLQLVEPGTIPVTTSGKVRRSAAKEIFLRSLDA